MSLSDILLSFYYIIRLFLIYVNTNGTRRPFFVMSHQYVLPQVTSKFGLIWAIYTVELWLFSAFEPLVLLQGPGMLVLLPADRTLELQFWKTSLTVIRILLCQVYPSPKSLRHDTSTQADVRLYYG